MSKNILLSIVIPTRNRFQYARSCIKSILNISSSDFEVIVQDNSDNNQLEVFLQSFCHDKRLVYHHTTEQVDAIKNFNIGGELAQGEYITFLGDDDGINPEIIEVLKWAKKNHIDALVPSRPVQYNWPDISYRLYKNQFSAMLTIKSFTGKIRICNPEKEILLCIKSAGSNYLRSFIPKIYYGVIKRSILNEVKGIAGTFFPGLSPDLTGAMAAAHFVTKLAVMDYPLFVPGSSGNSGAGWGAGGKHIGELESFPHLPKKYVKNWSSLVPRFFSGTTIWAENIVQALQAINRKDRLKDFNIALLHAQALVYHFHKKQIILKSFITAITHMKKNIFLNSLFFIYYYFYVWFKRLKYLIINVIKILGINFSKSQKNVKNIEDAVSYLDTYLDNKQIDVKKYLLNVQKKNISKKNIKKKSF